MASPEGVVSGRVGGVVAVLEVLGRGPHRDRRGPEDVAQLPVVHVVGALPADVADDLGAPCRSIIDFNLRHLLDSQVRRRDVCGGERRQGVRALVGVDVPARRVLAFEQGPRVPEGGAHGPVGIDGILRQVPGPGGVRAGGLEGGLVEVVLIRGPGRRDGGRREGLARLADDADGLLEGRLELAAVVGHEGVSRQGRIARVVVDGKAVPGPVAGSRELRLVDRAGIRRECAEVQGRRAAHVCRQGVVRPRVVGHPLEGVLVMGRHVGAEAHDEDLVAGVLQGLGPQDGEPPLLVLRRGRCRRRNRRNGCRRRRR